MSDCRSSSSKLTGSTPSSAKRAGVTKGSIGDHAQAKGLEIGHQQLGHGAQADEADGLAAQLAPGAVVAVEVTHPDALGEGGVGAGDAAALGQDQADGELDHGLRVAAGGIDDRDTRGQWRPPR